MTEASRASLPLLAAQMGVWVAQKLEPASLMFNVNQYADIEGSLDVDVFEAALRQVLAETEALRIKIVEQKGEVGQEVTSGSDWTLTYLDLAGEADPPGKAQQWMRAEMTRSFDLTTGPLFTWALLKISDRRYFWYQRCHHIVMDGYSCGLVAQRVAEVYTALTRSEPCRETRFKSLTRLLDEEREYRSSPQLEHDRAFWSRQPAADAAPLLPAGRSAAPADVPLRETACLAKETVTDICTAAGLGQSAWPGAVLALSGAYFAKLTGQDAVTLELPVTSRATAVQRYTPSMLSNILPLTVRVRPGVGIAEVLADVSSSVRGLLQRQRYRQEDLHSDLGRAGGQRTFGPTINIMSFNYDLDFAGQRAVAHPLTNGPVGDLAITVTQDANPHMLRVDFDANPALYTREELSAHLARFQRLVEAVRVDPDRPVSGVEVLDEAERRLVLEQWNDTRHTVPDGVLPVLFEEQVERSPEATAVVFEGVELSYGELNARVNRLARLLVEQGAGPERFVAVALPRSLELVVALLAVLKSGAAYVPVDPDYPAERIAFMLKDAAPILVLTTSGTRIETAAPVLLLDEPGTAAALAVHSDTDVTDADRIAVLTARHPVYVIYTSGSTGAPKGVVVTHAGLTNQLCWLAAATELTSQDVVLARTPVSFDAAGGELWAPLVSGAAVAMASAEATRDPEQLLAFIGRQGVTVAQFVPSLLAAMPLDERGRGIRALLSGGEALPAALAREAAAAWDASVINLYGPTEATIQATAGRLDGLGGDAATVPIGRPVWNTRVYVLDGLLRPVPDGVAGEVYIAGDQLARGYLNRPALTAERFVADPFGPVGGRLYRTGDVARRAAAGQLEYVGRVDDQVKVRGFRIELGEIESVLTGHPAVTQATVIVREDRPGDKRLVGYVVSTADPLTLRTHVAKVLPEYMVPSVIVPLDALPLTPNGKLDRRALPAPEFTASAEGRAPRTPQEEILCQIFAEVLGVEQVSIDDNFFELGGDSILALQVVGRAQQAGLGITPKDVFQLRSVHGLASVVTVLTDEVSEDPDAGIGELPPTPMMRWLFDKNGPIDHFHQAMVVRTPAGLTVDDVRAGLGAVVERHDMLRLRTVYGAADATPTLEVQQRDAVDSGARVSRIDVCGLSEEEVHELTRTELAAAAERLAPDVGVAFTVTWFDAGPTEHGRLLWVIHHLAVDGVSWRILVSDLAAACAAAATGVTPSLSVTGTPFRTWATQLQQLAMDPKRVANLPTWTAALEADDQSLGPVALDPARDTESTLRSVTLSLPEAQTAALLTTVPSAFHATVQDALLAGLALAVADWRRRRNFGQSTAVLLNVEGHGRESLAEPVDLSGTVGWFTSLYPMLLDPGEVDWPDIWAGGEDLGRAFKCVKEQVREFSANGTEFGLLRYLNTETGAELAALPTPQIGFNYLGRFDVSSAPDGGDWGAVPEFGLVGGGDASMAVTHAIEINSVTENHADGARLTVRWTWPQALFSDATVRDLAETWFRVLDALAAHGHRPDAGGHTPSDLSLVDLSQSEIDAFESELDSEWGTW
ncbi:amino acid adenylation domain-containing protein [Streptomyces sp. NR30]|uniref:Amino acid adenylation domain-containing protein n=1 Tax=Streptomyces guryensis TaxID=2886947 RepID=A0A9Q3VTA6_9ACTN|nr:amino acid adenylation domain-containing protein [Streptomyces guryensis]